MDSAMTITKIKNIYIMLLNAITLENIDKVSHFLDAGLAEMFEQRIKQNIKNNVQQKYDQPNITNIQILNENQDELTARATVKAIDYLVDRKTKAVVAGDNVNRMQKDVVLTFKKNSVEQKLSFSCPGCGAPLNLNATGLCEYCMSPIDTRFSPLVLRRIEVIGGN